MLDGFGQLRQGFFRYLDKPKLLEGSIRDVHPARAADLFFTVDMIEVAAGIVFNALVAEREQVGALPEGNGFHRADLGAAGQFALAPRPVHSRTCISSPGA